MKKQVKKLKKKLKKSLVLLQSLRAEVGLKPRSEEKGAKEASGEIQARHAATERVTIEAEAATEGIRGALDETIRRLTEFRASLHRASPAN